MTDPGTYDSKKKKHGYRCTINRENGDITIIGKRIPPESWLPEGWVKVSENRFCPQWPTCKYRRLNILRRPADPPEITPLCIKYNRLGEEITHQTCMDCTVFKEPLNIPNELPDGTSYEDLVKRSWRTAKNEEYHSLAGYVEEELDALEEKLFQEEMAKIPDRVTAVQKRWNPCKFRISVAKEEGELRDCGGCSSSKIVCNHGAAPTFGQVVTRSICKACPLAEKPE